MKHRTLGFALVAALCTLPAKLALAQNHEDRWQPLFNGTNLEGWVTKGGVAPFEVVDGTIVGSAVLNSPNTFLTTVADYDNFIFEGEIRVTDNLNSGFMFRAASLPEYRNGVVHGYQAEFDPSRRSWSGGIFEEQARLWLYPLSRNPACQAAFRADGWNSYRIEAVGNVVQTILNGTPCARLLDKGRQSGFIGLQVHSVREDNNRLGKPGATASWRNLRILPQATMSDLTPFPETVPQVNLLLNQLSDIERSDGWQLLWDGKTTNGWRSAKGDSFPKTGWRIEDGLLIVEAADGGEAVNGGDIITTTEFADFELELQFRITPGANSGIKYYVDPDLLKGEGSAIGLEFQILDDALHPDAKMGVAGKRKIGSLYDLIRADDFIEPGNDNKRVNPPGQWNHARIVSRGGKVEHWLNHIKVVEFDRFSQTFAALVEYSKYKDWENFGRWATGPILLQDHGNEVAFHSIKLRPIVTESK